MEELIRCYNCGEEFKKEDLTKTYEYGSWCSACLDQTPGDQTGYCSESCRLYGNCDGSC